MKNKHRIQFVLVLTMILAMTLSGCLEVPVPIENTPKITQQQTEAPVVTSEPTPTDTALERAEWLAMAEQTLPEYIPLDVLMSFDEYSAPQISDDGTRILYRHVSETSDSIKYMDIETGRTKNVPWPADAYGIPYFSTTPNNDIVLLFIDDMGDENFGLYVVNLANGKTRTVLPGGENDCTLMGFNPENGNECFLAVFDFDYYVYNIYKLNLLTYDLEKVFENPGNVVSWTIDTHGRLNLIMTITDDASYHMWLRNDKDNENTVFSEDEWTNIITWDYEDTDTSGLIDYDDRSGNIILIDSSFGNSTAIVSYNIDADEKTLIHQDEEGIYEPAGMWLNIETHEITGVAYQKDKLEWTGLNDKMQSHFDYLSSVAEGDYNIVDSDAQDNLWLVSYDSDTKSTDYYLYDSQKMEATFLYNANPIINEYEYAPMEPISYESSDGLTIHGYVTFPLNMERENLPLVVLVHGGPWARDTWGFDPEVQFLANRGYMVLQVNFRGSTGYGKEFMLAGDREWGRKMHQDILDAVDWSIEQGWTNPERVAVYGASYGGYEALVCAAFTPEKFACAIDLFGPSSLLTLVSSQPPQWNSYSNNLYRSIGNPAIDSEEMMERSPYYSAANISIPLLVVQGGHDVRVTPVESEQLVDAMHEAGLYVEYIFLPYAGHGFSSDEDIMKFYVTAEKFLAEYLGGICKAE